MRLTVSGSDRLGLTPAETVAALRDPVVLSRAMPGDGGVERTAPGVATVMATAGIAGTRGTYRARVHVVAATDDRFDLRIAAAGEPGTVEAELTVEVHADDAGSRIDHRLTATLEGRLAGLGRKVLEGAVASGAHAFLEALEDAVRNPVVEPVLPAATGVGGTPAPGDVDTGHGTTVGTDRPASPVRTALTAAAAGALATAGALRWWQSRQGA